MPLITFRLRSNDAHFVDAGGYFLQNLYKAGVQTQPIPDARHLRHQYKGKPAADGDEAAMAAQSTRWRRTQQGRAATNGRSFTAALMHVQMFQSF
jgi:hypothetical protein